MFQNSKEEVQHRTNKTYILSNVYVLFVLCWTSSSECQFVNGNQINISVGLVSFELPLLSTGAKLEPRPGPRPVVLNLFHCWDPLNATDVVWDPQVKIEKVCAPE